MKSFGAYGSAAALALLLLPGCGASAQSRDARAQQDQGYNDTSRTPQVRMATVPAGSELMLALDNPLDSSQNHEGDTFTARVVQSVVVNGKTIVPEGAKVEGRVTEAVPAKKGAGKGKLALAFDKLRFPDGYRTDIVGTFEEVSASKKGRNAKVIGGSAVGGAILGRIFGKGTKSAVVGSIIGGAAGTAVVMSKEGEQAKLSADTPFKLKLDQAIQVPQT